MKRYIIYRDIRKRALIFGMTVGSFALMMTSVITSLLLVIFSFNLFMVAILICWNIGLYILLIKAKTLSVSLSCNSGLLLLSNKQSGIDGYND